MTHSTPCECPRAGWCERHQCVKTVFQHWDCRHVPDRFHEWEQGDGERLQWSDFQPEAAAVPEGPGLLRQAFNYGRAVGRHIGNGRREVPETVAADRLSVCRNCDDCDQASLVCRHAQCGCQLLTKTRWASEACPLGHWLALTSASHTPSKDS
jgi:hypothetical protein